MAFSPVMIGSMPVRIPSPPAVVPPPTTEGQTPCPFKKGDLIRQLQEESDFTRKLLQDSFERERDLNDKLAKALSELHCIREALKRKEKQNTDLREGYARLQANSRGTSEKSRKAKKWADPAKLRDHLERGADAMRKMAESPVLQMKTVEIKGKQRATGVYGRALPNAPLQQEFEAGRSRFVEKLVPVERPNKELILGVAKKLEAKAAKIAPSCDVSSAPKKLAGLTAEERIELHRREGSGLESILRRTEPEIVIPLEEEVRLASSSAPVSQSFVDDSIELARLQNLINKLEYTMTIKGPLHNDFDRWKSELQDLLRKKRAIDRRKRSES